MKDVQFLLAAISQCCLLFIQGGFNVLCLCRVCFLGNTSQSLLGHWCPHRNESAMHSVSLSMSSPPGSQSTRSGSDLLKVGSGEESICVPDVSIQQVQILFLPCWIVNMLCDSCLTFIHVYVGKISWYGEKHAN